MFRYPLGIATLLKNARIRRLLVAYLVFVAAEWGTWLAVLIYAFDADGATAVGLVAMAQLVPAAILAPVAPLLVGRMARPTPLVFAYGLQALTVSITALAVMVGPSWLVYLGAAAMTTSIAFGRPAQATTLVAVAQTPEELTAANGAGGAVDGAGIVLGPLMVALLYGLVGPAGFLLIIAAALCGAVLLAASLRVERWENPASMLPTRAGLGEALHLAFDRRGPILATAALVAAWVAAGFLDVLIVVLALGQIGGGSGLVGALNAALGVGGIVAGLVAARLVGAGSVISIGVGLAVAAAGVGGAVLSPSPIVLASLLAVVGAGHSLAEIGSRSMLMRLVPARSVGAVFGLIEGGYAAALALGAALGPLVLIAAPVPVALAAIAVALAAMAVIMTPALVRVARTIRVPAREVEVLRRVPLFAPLPVPTMEWLARSAQRVEVPSGETVIREDEPGDLFYAIDTGAFDVAVRGRSIASLGPGDYFGEIALLRNSPRTATVTATTDASLVALDRDHFVAAVTDHVVASRTATDIVTKRLDRNAR